MPSKSCWWGELSSLTDCCDAWKILLGTYIPTSKKNPQFGGDTSSPSHTTVLQTTSDIDTAPPAVLAEKLAMGEAASVHPEEHCRELPFTGAAQPRTPRYSMARTNMMGIKCLCPGKGLVPLQSMGTPASHSCESSQSTSTSTLGSREGVEGVGVTHSGHAGPWPWMQGT